MHETSNSTLTFENNKLFMRYFESRIYKPCKPRPNQPRYTNFIFLVIFSPFCHFAIFVIFLPFIYLFCHLSTKITHRATRKTSQNVVGRAWSRSTTGRNCDRTWEHQQYTWMRIKLIAYLCFSHAVQPENLSLYELVPVLRVRDCNTL